MEAPGGNTFTDEVHVLLGLDRLAPEGILVYHISNRYYAIERPLGRSAAQLGLTGLFQVYSGNAKKAFGDLPSSVAIFARSTSAFGEIATDARWSPLTSDGGTGVD